MINLSLEIDPSQPVPVKVLRDTAKYLLALSGAAVVQEIEEPKKPVIEKPIEKIETPVNTNDPEIDSEGVKWDYKVHSSRKLKTPDGRWKAKRNIEVQPNTPLPVMNIPAPPPQAPAEDLLGKFMSLVTDKIVKGKMTHNDLAKFLNENGIADVPSIQNYPHLLPELIRKIEV